MKLILYNNNSENNKLNKDIVKIVELEGYLREETSLINPQIMIEFYPEVFGKYVKDDNQIYVIYDGIKITWDTFINQYVLSANYLYIPDFNRYYFINDITSVRNNLWRLTTHVDVLMSYQKEISETNAFVSRNEFSYDNMVKDDLMTYYYDKNVFEYIPIKGNYVNKTFTSTTNIFNDNITITCINEDIEFNLDSVTPPVSSLPTVTANTSGDDMMYKTYCTYPVNITHLAKRLIGNNSNLANFIISIVAFPFLIDYKANSTHPLKLGTTELKDTGSSSSLNNDAVKVDDLDKNISKYYVIADFTISGSSFQDYEPYTQYEIFLPYLGWIPLSADVILNKRLIVYYIVNYQTGKSQVTIYDITNSKIVYTSNAQVGVVIPVNSTNAREVNDQRNSNNIGLGVGLLTSTLSTAVGVATFNPFAVASGLIASGSTIANYIQNQNTNYLRATGSIGSGQSGLYLPQEVKIRKTSYKPKNYDINFSRLFGKPLNQYVKLGDLSGFTIVGDEHLENFGSALKSECDEIKILLKEGVIL